MPEDRQTLELLEKLTVPQLAELVSNEGFRNEVIAHAERSPILTKVMFAILKQEENENSLCRSLQAMSYEEMTEEIRSRASNLDHMNFCPPCWARYTPAPGG